VFPAASTRRLSPSDPEIATIRVEAYVTRATLLLASWTLVFYHLHLELRPLTLSLFDRYDVCGAVFGASSGTRVRLSGGGIDKTV
jgi:hypothetical protein